jgi:flagellar biosynthesis/type III secretory pathway protein FliH
MTNNKQISIEWFFNQLVANRIIVINGTTYWDKVKTKYEILLEQAKEMHQEEIDQSYRDGFEFALINECAKQSTSEASKYAEGYKEGYHRAIENAKYQINKWIDKELKITQP